MKQTTLFFGDKQNAVPVAVLNGDNGVALQKTSIVASKHDFKKLIFPFQVHGTKGLITQDDVAVASFTHEADWIITNLSGIGVGILTADCVPLLIYDPVHQAIGAVHAGWRGAVDGVVAEAIGGMQHHFGSRPTDVQAWIGPHARTCCYQVDQKFYETVRQKKFGKDAWHTMDEQLFFDLKQCCIDQLLVSGVQEQQVADIGVCTVCTPSYCSYRREKEAALRNISFIGIIE